MPAARKKDHRHAFTLVEALVAFAIIAISMALAFSAFSRMRDASREVSCLANLRSFGNATLAFAGDNGGLPGWNGLGPKEQEEGGTSYPDFGKWLIPKYLPETLYCPLATRKERELTSGFRYAGSAGLAQYYPKLKNIPAPLSRVVLAVECYGANFWSSTHLNMTMYGVSDANAKDDRMKSNEGSVRRSQYHGTSENRGLHLFFLDGHAALIRPTDGDWYQKPIYGDATNGGYFYDRNQFNSMKAGRLIVH